MEQQSVFNFILDNLKNIFYPEDWLDLDLKLAKSELMALLVLDRHGELTMGQFSDFMQMPMNTATGLVNRLVNNGYILRERSETDRRLVLIKSTEAGREITGRFKDLICEYMTLIDQVLTQEEKDTILKVILKVINLIKTKASSGKYNEEDSIKIRKIEIE